MSVLMVNGTPLPTPDGGFKVESSEGVDATRNAKFEMISSKITDRRIVNFNNLTWNNLTRAEWRIIKLEIDKYYGVVKFDDISSDKFRYMRFYWGEESTEPLREIEDGIVTVYKKYSCNIIDDEKRLEKLISELEKLRLELGYDE